MTKEPPVRMEDGVPWNPNYPVRNYRKMEICKHQNFTLIFNAGKIFFKCRCSMVLSESSAGVADKLGEIGEVLLEEKERLKGRRVKEVLLN